jgi:hypothetical protein
MGGAAVRHRDAQPPESQPGSRPRTAQRRIRLIIVAAMAAGLLVAVVLVAMPFVPAEPHVLTGLVLLAFALGRALLAVLSVRFSDQPQRWAAAPAAFLGLAGVPLSAAWPRWTRCSGGYGRQSCWDSSSGCCFGSNSRLSSRGARWLLYPVLAALVRGRCWRRLRDRARVTRREGLSHAQTAD